MQLENLKLQPTSLSIYSGENDIHVPLFYFFLLKKLNNFTLFEIMNFSSLCTSNIRTLVVESFKIIEH